MDGLEDQVTVDRNATQLDVGAHSLLEAYISMHLDGLDDMDRGDQSVRVAGEVQFSTALVRGRFVVPEGLTLAVDLEPCVGVVLDGLEDGVSEGCGVLCPSAEHASYRLSILESTGGRTENAETCLKTVGVEPLGTIPDQDTDGFTLVADDLDSDLALVRPIGVVGVGDELYEGADDVAAHCLGGILLECSAGVLDLAFTRRHG